MDIESSEESEDVNADATTDENESGASKPFDPALTTTHSYLGNDLEILRGRTLLDNGVCLNLPILFEKSMILFPEQTLPMFEKNTQIVNMLRTCIEKDRTFGVVRAGKKKDPLIGTTAEIYEYSDSDSGCFCIKARGRQRFKVLKFKKTQGQILADVKILPEVILGPPLHEERLVSLDRLRKIPVNEKEASEQEYRVSRQDSAVTPWPSWVYRQYDVRLLTMKIHEHLRFIVSKGSVIPKEPVELSFWLAQNLFVSNAAKIALLQDDCAISRLQYAAKALSTLGRKSFVCAICRQAIGKHTDIVPMNKKGLQEAYCNPYGAIHETVTLSNTTNVVLSVDPPSTVCSWFPGYAWTIASCAGCNSHIGWKFTAVNKDLKPRQFWGLTRKNLLLKYAFMSTDETNSLAAESDGGEDVRSHLSSESDNDDDDDDDDDEDARQIIRYRLDLGL
ncbi:protein cereblon-like [Venturia canescens]|uniref:protein cereblon-like n=1 Tax=Venturia canescens TaxID=32260 RepID=UPI001C9BFAA9|nr:protein cereblon-like [Venturia canescens]